MYGGRLSNKAGVGLSVCGGGGKHFWGGLRGGGQIFYKGSKGGAKFVEGPKGGPGRQLFFP